jgi:hypothetical protein
VTCFVFLFARADHKLAVSAEIVIEFMGLKETFEVDASTTASALVKLARSRFQIDVRLSLHTLRTLSAHTHTHTHALT